MLLHLEQMLRDHGELLAPNFVNELAAWVYDRECCRPPPRGIPSGHIVACPSAQWSALSLLYVSYLRHISLYNADAVMLHDLWSLQIVSYGVQSSTQANRIAALLPRQSYRTTFNLVYAVISSADR